MQACSIVSDSFPPHRLLPTRLLCLWDSKQEEWSGLPFPPAGDLPDPGTEPSYSMSPALAARVYHCVPWEAARKYMLRVYNELFRLHAKQTYEVGKDIFTQFTDWKQETLLSSWRRLGRVWSHVSPDGLSRHNSPSGGRALGTSSPGRWDPGAGAENLPGWVRGRAPEVAGSSFGVNQRSPPPDEPHTHLATKQDVLVHTVDFPLLT